MAPLAASLAIVCAVVPAHADLNGRPGNAEARMYVVKLAEPPVTTYQGGLKGLARTAPSPGNRLRTGTDAVKAYVRHLDDRRDEVLDDVPGVRKLYEYSYAFNGFAAKLTARQAAQLSATPGVVSLTPDKAVPLPPAPDGSTSAAATWDVRTPAAARGDQPRHRRSVPDAEGRAAGAKGSTDTADGSVPPPDIPRFLGLDGEKGLWSKLGGPEHAGEGTIIGVVDGGIDPTNPMLAPLSEPRPDADAIANKWHGTCDAGDDPAHKVTCNNKLIGARWFRGGVPDPTSDDIPSPRDLDSHGTHTATTAAGNYATPAELPELGVRGKVSGIAPAARVAAYKACWHDGCWDTDLTAAVDQAVADGVDVISYSIGGQLTTSESMEAMFNAAKAGVFVSAAAGNAGPETVGNTAPWITTVAAETHDSGYDATLVLGDGRRFTNVRLQAPVPTAPLVTADDVRKSDADAAQATLCAPGTLDPAKVKGRIVICDRGGVAIWDKGREIADGGGVGMAVANTPTSAKDIFPDDYVVPSVQLSQEEGKAVGEYAAKAGATGRFVSGTIQVRAPQVTSFSSGGPELYSGGDLLKPDIAAPGERILAGVVPDDDSPDRFGFFDGTSMATPHISGLAALLKQLHPDWSPMEVKSALMTTATTTDNEGRPIGRQVADSATPLDYGGGSPRATLAADPGLVYDSTSADWTAYLCGMQRPTTVDGVDACAKARSLDPSDLNYPSIAVGDLAARQTVTRTVTNVGKDTATYRATLQTPPGYQAQVTPQSLTLRPGASATYRVTFTRTDAPYGAFSSGSLTWSDAHSHHRVTSPIALRAARIAAPGEIALRGERSLPLTVRAGWKGELTARAELYKAEKITGTVTGEDQDFFSAPGASAADAKIPVHVPEGAPFTRVAVDAADHVPGSIVDVFAFDKNGVEVSPEPQIGSQDYIDLPPGDYDVYVVQYATPKGTDSQQYTLRLWKVGQTAPAVRPTVTPATQSVTPAAQSRMTVKWPDAARGERYVGIIEYGDGSQPEGLTKLAVTPQ
ncbi:S8 family peptidase [Streptomyces sp. NBC_00582]|uniref:S8 family peptidase n=1 Tax=Streptomyces sp. NBC_00582 TaxID=2975783 RepID=UPI002E81C406|nr:S8 family peptidase [Streptomyces sp. NBC_00582]WUB59209.1 S8 family serine peptidase [Streptomyces sp. NBC_00582]